MTDGVTTPNPELQKAIAGLEKRFGPNVVMRGASDMPPVESISTGSLGLDRATGVGGFPRGKMTEIHGDFSTGKSTISIHSLAEALRLYGVAGYVDMEHAMDEDYAAALDVDIDLLALSQPDSGEQAFEIADALITAGVPLVIVDSIPALIPESRLTGDYKDKNYGDIAHLLSRSLPKLKALASKHQTALVFTNQMRVDQKGFVPPGSNYQPMKTYGGEAIKYFADLRIELRRRFEKETREDEQIVIAKCVKNKLHRPFKTAEFRILYGQGVDQTRELIELGVGVDAIKKGGSWYEFSDGEKQQGERNAADYLREHPELASEIRERVLNV